MPQLLIDTDAESVENLRDTVLLITAIADRKQLARDAKLDAKAEPELSPSVFAKNPAHGAGDVAAVAAAVATAAAAPEAKPKRTRKPRAAAPAPAATPVPLPPVVAATTEERRGPTITPAIAARIAEAGAPPPPPPPPPAPLTLVGEAPAAPAGPTFRDVMLVITQGLQSGKLTNAEVVEICKRQGIDGPTALPAQPMLNGPVLAGIKMLLATKG